MQIRNLRTTVLACTLTTLLSTGFALAQDTAKQDLKTAGTDTKKAAKEYRPRSSHWNRKGLRQNCQWN